MNAYGDGVTGTPEERERHRIATSAHNPVATHDFEAHEFWLRFWVGRRIETVRLGPGSGL